MPSASSTLTRSLRDRSPPGSGLRSGGRSELRRTSRPRCRYPPGRGRLPCAPRPGTRRIPCPRSSAAGCRARGGSAGGCLPTAGPVRTDGHRRQRQESAVMARSVGSSGCVLKGDSMAVRSRVPRRCIAGLALVACVTALAACSSSSKTTAPTTSASGSAATTTAPASSTPATPLHVTWMQGFDAPGTPAKYDQVGVIKVGPSSANNVLCSSRELRPEAAYFVPLAKWIVVTLQRLAGVVGRALREPARRPVGARRCSSTARQRALRSSTTTTSAISRSPRSRSTSRLPPRGHREVRQELGNEGRRPRPQPRDRVREGTLGGKVVLGGHSLGGTVVTVYATWDFSGPR